MLRWGTCCSKQKMERFLSGLCRGVSHALAGLRHHRRRGKSFLIKMLIYVFFLMQFLMHRTHEW